MIHHSDAESSYTSFALSEHLDRAGIAASIGSVDDAYDNALMESTSGRLRTQLIKPRPTLGEALSDGRAKSGEFAGGGCFWGLTAATLEPLGQTIPGPGRGSTCYRTGQHCRNRGVTDVAGEDDISG